MKITGLLVLKCNPEGTDPVILANATDVSRFFFFDRPSVRELIVFFSRTVAKQTPPGHHGTVQREVLQSVQCGIRRVGLMIGNVHRVELVECYKCTKNQFNRISLVQSAFIQQKWPMCMDDHYPVQSAFSLLNQVLDEYQKNFGDSWRTVQADSARPWPYLNQALTKFQDPAEADKLLKIQGELDLTKDMVDETIKKVLERGEKLDSLMEKSSDLSVASRAFYNQAQQTNQCCTIL